MKRNVLLLFSALLLLLCGCNAANLLNTHTFDFDEVYNSFDDILEEWNTTQTILKVETISTEYVQDILMNEGANHRRNANTKLEITLAYNPEHMDKSDYPSVVLETAFIQIIEALRTNPHSNMLASLDFIAVNSNSGESMAWNRLYDANNLTEDAIIPQESDEYHAQTIAFNFVQDLNREFFSDGVVADTPYTYNEATLKRFGIDDESNKLCIQIPIYRRPYMGDDFLRTLSQQSKDLFNAIIDDKEAKGYLVQNGVTTVVVAFEITWEPQGDSHHTFIYSVQ